MWTRAAVVVCACMSSSRFATFLARARSRLVCAEAGLGTILVAQRCLWGSGLAIVPLRTILPMARRLDDCLVREAPVLQLGTPCAELLTRDRHFCTHIRTYPAVPAPGPGCIVDENNFASSPGTKQEQCRPSTCTCTCTYCIDQASIRLTRVSVPGQRY